MTKFQIMMANQGKIFLLKIKKLHRRISDSTDLRGLYHSNNPLPLMDPLFALIHTPPSSISSSYIQNTETFSDQKMADTILCLELHLRISFLSLYTTNILLARTSCLSFLICRGDSTYQKKAVNRTTRVCIQVSTPLFCTGP